MTDKNVKCKVKLPKVMWLMTIPYGIRNKVQFTMNQCGTDV